MPAIAREQFIRRGTRTLDQELLILNTDDLLQTLTNVDPSYSLASMKDHDLGDGERVWLVNLFWYDSIDDPSVRHVGHEYGWRVEVEDHSLRAALRKALMQAHSYLNLGLDR